MKKVLLAACLASAAFAPAAHASMTFTTSAPVGTEVRILANVVSATVPITLDMGNGVEQKFTINPADMAYARWIETTIEGPTITVSGNITEFELENAQLTSAVISDMGALKKLELSNNELVSFELTNYAPLTTLNLSHNKIVNSPSENSTITLEHCGSTLEDLNLSHNEGLQCLDARYLEAVKYLTINDCPDFASIFICMPEESQSSLYSINLSNCALSNFYPVSLPNLYALDLSNNNLMTVGTDNPFTLGNYPKLGSLSINGNKYVDQLDVTKCTNLEKLYINDCAFEHIDLSQCPELHTLNAANNNITSLDLGNNTLMSYLNVSDNPIATLDVTRFPNISEINIKNTNISRLDLMKAFYLKQLIASNSKIQFLDFNGCQAQRLTKIDISNCPGFTYESMAYTLKTLPQARKAYSTNLFLTGSNAEHSDTESLQQDDMGWIPDVDGDGTATFSPLNITLQDATDTGTNKTGTVDRLYPYFGYSMPYDLDVMQTTGGQFILCQWQPRYFQTMESVHTQALKGVPMCVYPYPEEGMSFRSVTVNGEEIFSNWFIVSEDATIKVNFSNGESCISFDVTQGNPFSFLVNTAQANGTVSVDWGTGTRTEYPGQSAYVLGSTECSGTRIDGTAASNKITVYGDIAAIDVHGYGDVAADFGLWDNHITGADLSNCPGLRLFNSYWNPISSIDFSKCPNLNILDISYNNLTSVDLSHNNNLLMLKAYSDGFGEDGIARLNSIDVTNMPYLQYLDVKNNNLSSIDLTKNPLLNYAHLFGNQLTSVDLSKNTALGELYIGKNQLTSLDVTNNTNLTDLSVENNLLTSLDVSKNTLLYELSFANNDIKDIDLSKNANLHMLYVNGNGMNAEQLNDLYYKLPERIDLGDEDPNKLHYNLGVALADDKVENEAKRADSSIAEYRGWTPNHKGSNGGCDNAYLDILSSPNGSVTVSDAAGNTYAHGSKVTKYLPLIINATPADGYAFANFSLNEEEPQEGTTFDMPGIYTRLSANFKKADGIDAAEAAKAQLSAVDGGVQAVAEEGRLTVYNMAGQPVAETSVSGAVLVALPQGCYVARLATADGVTTNSFVVK